MKLLFQLVFLFLAPSATVRANEFDCRFLYTQTAPSSGPWVAKAGYLDTTTPEALYYRLGRGVAGGTVYRVVPTDPKTKTYLKKTYREEGKRDNDASALGLLGQPYPGLTSPFRIPKVTKLGQYDLELEETPGRDLHSLLIDNLIDDGLKTQLRETYERKLEEFRIFLFKGPRIGKGTPREAGREYFADGKRDGTNLFEGDYLDESGKQIPFLIKSDNIIVHWVGGDDPFVMTLIDPY